LEGLSHTPAASRLCLPVLQTRELNVGNWGKRRTLDEIAGLHPLPFQRISSLSSFTHPLSSSNHSNCLSVAVPDSGLGTMALCATCRDFDIQKFSSASQNTQSFELTLVAIAASEGCPFCKFIYANKSAHNVAWEMSTLWVHFKMLTPPDVGYDMLPPGPGLRFTQLQVWVGSKKAPVKGRYHKEFRLVSDPGMCLIAKVQCI
jgi:hypothetical protein